MRVTYIGHATVAIEIDGVKLLTDPVLSSRVWHLRRHAEAPGPGLIEGVDAVLLSHLHADHLHRRSLARIDAEVPVLAPPGSASLLTRYGRRNVTELRPGDAADIGPVAITATPAAHTARRYPFAPRADSIGFLIAGSRSAYFAGDTGLFEEMAGLGAGSGNSGLDLALLPVWGWGPTLGPGHLNPSSAARAAAMIRPGTAVPIHWGTLFPYGLGTIAEPYLSQPPVRFARTLGQSAPGVRVEILAPGRGALHLGEDDSA